MINAFSASSPVSGSNSNSGNFSVSPTFGTPSMPPTLPPTPVQAPNATSATDRLSQLLEQLKAEQAAVAATKPNPDADRSAQLASLANALSSFQTAADVPEEVKVDVFQRAMDGLRRSYAQGKPSATDLLNAVRGQVKVAPPSAPVYTPEPTPISIPAPLATPELPIPPVQPLFAAFAPRPVMPPQPLPPVSGIRRYIANLAQHLAQHGRLVLTDYRAGATA